MISDTSFNVIALEHIWHNVTAVFPGFKISSIDFPHFSSFCDIGIGDKHFSDRWYQFCYHFESDVSNKIFWYPIPILLSPSHRFRCWHFLIFDNNIPFHLIDRYQISNLTFPVGRTFLYCFLLMKQTWHIVTALLTDLISSHYFTLIFIFWWYRNCKRNSLISDHRFAMTLISLSLITFLRYLIIGMQSPRFWYRLFNLAVFVSRAFSILFFAHITILPYH